jgi:ankyrin repeat protein
MQSPARPLTPLDKALFDAVARRDGEAALALIARGADVNACEAFEIVVDRDRYPAVRTPLMAAIATGDAALARRLLAAPGMDVSIGDACGGDTALAGAVRLGDVALVETLLAAGADVGVPAGDGRSPVVHAIEAGHPDIACRLLDAGPCCDPVDALVDAAFRGQATVVDRLLAAGASIDAIDKGGNTPLVSAAWGGRDEMLLMLLQRGADLAGSGGRALEFAANAGHVSTVQLLAGRGVALDGRNGYGWTPLMTAAWQGHAEVVACLLALGADRHLTDDTGKTALDWAREAGHHPVVALLA